MIDRATKAGQWLMPHQQGGTRTVADSQNGTALHQASQIPGGGDFLPIFLPKEATRRSRGAISPGNSDQLEWPIRVGYQLPKLVMRVRFPSPASLSFSYLVIFIFGPGSAAARHSLLLGSARPA
jgi:hypothetical protein